MKILILISLIVVLFTGCWDMKEVEDQLIVMMLGVEKEEYGYSLYYFVVDAIEYKKSPKEAMYMLTTTGDTLEICHENINKMNPKSVMLSHTKILFLGENLLKDKKYVTKLMDELMADSKVDKNMYMMAVEGDIKKTENVEIEVNELISKYLVKLNQNNRNITLEEAVIKMSKGDKKISIPKIEIVENKIKYKRIDL